MPLAAMRLDLVFLHVYLTVSKKEAARRCAAMRLVFVSSLLCLTVLKIRLCRYEISPHFFTLNFDFINDAACRYAALRLALIF